MDNLIKIYGHKRVRINNLMLETVIFFIIVPVFLVFVFYSPLNELFFLNTSSPNIISIYFSNFAHSDFYHLKGNLICYFLIMPLLLYFRLEKKNFYLAIFFIFLMLPFILSWYNIVQLPKNITMGFSGINAALCGYFPYAFLTYFQKTIDIKLRKTNIFNILCLILLFNLLFVVSRYKIYGYIISDNYLIVIFLLIVIMLGQIWTEKRNIAYSLGSVKNQRNKIFLMVIIFLFTYVLTLIFFVQLFPTSLYNNSGKVNIVLHYFGYCFGLFIPFFTNSLMPFSKNSFDIPQNQN